MINVLSMSWEDEKKLEDELYEKFVEFRCNENISVTETYEKLNIRYASAMAYRLRERFRKDGFEVKGKKSWVRDVDDSEYIYEKMGKFYISKNDKNKHNQYYGSYDSLTTAKKIRDELIKYNWNKKMLGSILENLCIE